MDKKIEYAYYIQHMYVRTLICLIASISKENFAAVNQMFLNKMRSYNLARLKHELLYLQVKQKRLT